MRGEIIPDMPGMWILPSKVNAFKGNMIYRQQAEMSSENRARHQFGIDEIGE